MLTVSACGTNADPPPSAAEPDQAVPAETAVGDTTTGGPDDTTTTTAPSDTTTTTAPSDTTTAASDDAAVGDTTTAGALDDATAADAGLALRAEVESVITARLSVDPTEGITDDQIACVAEASAAALDPDRLEPAVAAINTPSDSILPAGLVSDLERDRLLDGVVGCLPWSQLLLNLLGAGDTPPGVLECAQAAAAGGDTDRVAADILLFGGNLIAAYDLLPPDCVPGIGDDFPGLDDADQPASAAGRLTAAQLVAEGVSPESAACVAAQVDAISETLPQGADIDAQAEQEIFAAMLGCLTPPELALLSDPDSTEG